MAETAYTTYCNHTYQLTKDVLNFITDAVAPAIDSQCKDNPNADPKRYRVILYPFTRIVRWLITLEKLNQTHDLQAIGAAARSIFEHSLDLTWLQTFNDEVWFARFRAYPDIDRYMGAKKVVDHKKATPDSRIDAAPHEEFMKKMDLEEAFAA